MNRDEITTYAGGVAAGTQILGILFPMLGIILPPEVFQGISAIALFFLGFFTNKKQ